MDVSRETRARLKELRDEFRLPAGSVEQLAAILRAVADEPAAITTVRTPDLGAEVHVADSLTGFAVPELRAARRIADLGSGGGFPGLVLAVARPDAEVHLVESVGRKCAFLRRTSEAAGLGNVRVVEARAEGWRAGLAAMEAVTARAVAHLAVLAEYAAPLLVVGGVLVAWKGRRDEREVAAAAAAAAALGLVVEPDVAVPSRPWADERRLCVLRKVAPTPAGYPRRPGMARKRPLGLPRIARGTGAES